MQTYIHSVYLHASSYTGLAWRICSSMGFDEVLCQRGLLKGGSATEASAAAIVSARRRVPYGAAGAGGSGHGAAAACMSLPTLSFRIMWISASIPEHVCMHVYGD